MSLIRPADLVVIAAACALVALAAFAAWRPAGTPAILEMRSGGSVVKHALAADATLTMDGTRGTTVVEVRDGRARFVDAPCRDRICIAAGWLAARGDFAACVPNGVTLRVVGDGHYDAIAH